MSQEEHNQEYNVDSCEAILDTAKIIHAEELGRFSQCENKTNIGLAFTGVLLGAYLTYLSSYKVPLKDTAYLTYTILFKVAILILLSLAIIFFLKSIKRGEYEQIDLNNIVDSEFAGCNVGQVRLEIAATYKQVVDLNKSKLEKKLEDYDIGLKLVTWGFLLFVGHFLIEEVIRYVKWEKDSTEYQKQFR